MAPSPTHVLMLKCPPGRENLDQKTVEARDVHDAIRRLKAEGIAAAVLTDEEGNRLDGMGDAERPETCN